MPQAAAVRVGSLSTVKEMLPLLGACSERPNVCFIAANPFPARGVAGTKNSPRQTLRPRAAEVGAEDVRRAGSLRGSRTAAFPVEPIANVIDAIADAPC
jgi:hypothetical protein